MIADVLSNGLDLHDRTALVLGVGISGRAVAHVLADRGARVLASDQGELTETERRDLESARVEVETGSHERAKRTLDSFDFVFPSPGISPRRGFLAEIIERGIPVVSELELGVRLTDAPVVAVTGTNGKTTVCRLAEWIGREAGLEAVACGNLETKFVTAAASTPEADAFVVEASSFSLTFCETFHPRVAIVTNLAPDHLDWHGTFEHYRAAKAQIVARQRPDELYLYPFVQSELAGLAPANGPERVPFGPAPIDNASGAWADGSEIVVHLPDRSFRAPGVACLARRGSHFAADAAAAAAAMAYLGAGADAVERALLGFEFDSHRLEPVGSLRGVRVYDDSVATNTHATLAAIRTFSSPIVLIAGGRNKGIDLSQLTAEAERLRAVVALGEAAGDLERIFGPTSVNVRTVGSMSEAVGVAFEEARDGDVVLLSPACASFDMFTGYADRGRAFIQACREFGVRA